MGEGYNDSLWRRSVSQFSQFGVNIDGYMQLLSKTYGFHYWQLLTARGDESLEHSLEHLDPNFKMKEYLELFYEQLEIFAKNKQVFPVRLYVVIIVTFKEPGN